MNAPSALASAYVAFRDDLIDDGLLVPMGSDGLFGRGAVFESIVTALDTAIMTLGADNNPTILRFPPVISRTLIERTDYLKSFPDLLGSVHSFSGSDRDHLALIATAESGGDWAQAFTSTDVVLCPAACYPLYPMSSGQTVPDSGRIYDVVGTCFRREPSIDPARMQSFRQHEQVFIGGESEAMAFRNRWLERGTDLLRQLGLPVEAAIANDPFFGRVGKMLASSQRDQALKWEMVVPICSEEWPTAIASTNAHQDHFGAPFDIRRPGGSAAHSACIGFGLERCTLALLRHHGLDPHLWPSEVRSILWS